MLPGLAALRLSSLLLAEARLEVPLALVPELRDTPELARLLVLPDERLALEPELRVELAEDPLTVVPLVREEEELFTTVPEERVELLPLERLTVPPRARVVVCWPEEPAERLTLPLERVEELLERLTLPLERVAADPEERETEDPEERVELPEERETLVVPRELLPPPRLERD